jgi:hypothetical protein
MHEYIDCISASLIFHKHLMNIWSVEITKTTEGGGGVNQLLLSLNDI